MIIWSGYGFFVPIVSFAIFLATQAVVDSFLGAGFYTANAWPKSVACTLAAIVLWYMGRSMNKPQGKVYIDSETGEEVQLGGNSSFFFVPVEYWSIIVLIFGAFMAFQPHPPQGP